MARKTLGEKVDDLTIKVTTLEIEFKIFKKIGYAVLAGIGGILIKLFWTYIAKSPSIIANVIFNGTIT